ncbi:MAG: helix-turn-helix transcriptional regulator [Alphaproteobacteria bacterium]|nr:helix-turn-helix transcriptional regulator [Alphaproteobacteria bacterium]
MGHKVPQTAKIIGETLKNLREAAGFSLKEISAVLEVSYQQVQKYEQGYNRFPVDKLHRLRNFYGVSYADFFKGLPHGGEASALQATRFQDKESDLLACFLRVQHLQDKKLKRQIQDIVKILTE